ncbi:MAG: hypothetical protein Q9178_007946 [Gyalolechia marmorata]
MATGIETGALTLAVFPVMIDELERFAEGVRLIKRWRRFGHELATYEHTIRSARTLFLDTIKNFLKASATTQDEVDALSESPIRVASANPQYEEQLKIRLEHDYDNYFKTMKIIASHLLQPLSGSINKGLLTTYLDRLNLLVRVQPRVAHGVMIDKNLKAKELCTLGTKEDTSYGYQDAKDLALRSHNSGFNIHPDIQHAHGETHQIDDHQGHVLGENDWTIIQIMNHIEGIGQERIDQDAAVGKVKDDNLLAEEVHHNQNPDDNFGFQEIYRPESQLVQSQSVETQEQPHHGSLEHDGRTPINVRFRYQLLPIKKLGTILCERGGNSVRQAARTVKISYVRLSEVTDKAIQLAQENDRPLSDDEGFKNDIYHHRGALLASAEEEGDNICYRVINSRKNRKRLK